MNTNCNLAKNGWLEKSFYKMQAADAKELYQKKVLTAEAYILMLVRIHNKPGWKWTIDPKQFCREWGIKKSTFYNAISSLKTKGLLNWEPEGRLTLWYGSDIARSVQDVESKVQDVGLVVQDVGLTTQDIGQEKLEIPAQQSTCATTDYNQINSDTTDSEKVVSKEIKLPRSRELQLNRVNLADQTLQQAAKTYPGRLETAIAAWLEWAKTSEVNKPTRTLVQAIVEDWQPEAENPVVKERSLIRPPSSKQMAQLEMAKERREIRAIYFQPTEDGELVVVDNWKSTIPWWVYWEANCH